MRASDLLRKTEDSISEGLGQARTVGQETWEQVKVSAGEFKAEAERLLAEGKLRRIVIRDSHGEEVFNTRLIVGLAAVIAVPTLAAAGAMVALLTDCEVVLESKQDSPSPEPPKSGVKAKRSASRKAN